MEPSLLELTKLLTCLLIWPLLEVAALAFSVLMAASAWALSEE